MLPPMPGGEPPEEVEDPIDDDEEIFKPTKKPKIKPSGPKVNGVGFRSLVRNVGLFCKVWAQKKKAIPCLLLGIPTG